MTAKLLSHLRTSKLAVKVNDLHSQYVWAKRLPFWFYEVSVGARFWWYPYYGWFYFLVDFVSVCVLCTFLIQCLPNTELHVGTVPRNGQNV